jgi:hypothetical protein
MKKDTAQKKKIKVAMVAIDYERVKSVSGVVRLKEVLLNHSHWRSTMRAPRLEVEPTAMAFNFALADATWDFVPELKLLEILLEYRLAAFAKVDGKQNVEGNEVPLFQLECDWDVVFEVPEGFAPSDLDALADFAVANGQLNAFPYVRQYVQDVTSRAGWPPLVLPVFRIPAKRPKAVGARRQANADEHE